MYGVVLIGIAAFCSSVYSSVQQIKKAQKRIVRPKRGSRNNDTGKKAMAIYVEAIFDTFASMLRIGIFCLSPIYWPFYFVAWCYRSLINLAHKIKEAISPDTAPAPYVGRQQDAKALGPMSPASRKTKKALIRASSTKSLESASSKTRKKLVSQNSTMSTHTTMSNQSAEEIDLSTLSGALSNMSGALSVTSLDESVETESEYGFHLQKANKSIQSRAVTQNSSAQAAQKVQKSMIRSKSQPEFTNCDNLCTLPENTTITVSDDVTNELTNNVIDDVKDRRLSKDSVISKDGFAKEKIENVHEPLNLHEKVQKDEAEKLFPNTDDMDNNSSCESPSEKLLEKRVTSDLHSDCTSSRVLSPSIMSPVMSPVSLSSTTQKKESTHLNCISKREFSAPSVKDTVKDNVEDEAKMSQTKIAHVPEPTAAVILQDPPSPRMLPLSEPTVVKGSAPIVRAPSSEHGGSTLEPSPEPTPSRRQKSNSMDFIDIRDFETETGNGITNGMDSAHKQNSGRPSAETVDTSDSCDKRSSSKSSFDETNSIGDDVLHSEFSVNRYHSCQSEHIESNKNIASDSATIRSETDIISNDKISDKASEKSSEKVSEKISTGEDVSNEDAIDLISNWKGTRTVCLEK